MEFTKYAAKITHNGTFKAQCSQIRIPLLFWRGSLQFALLDYFLVTYVTKNCYFCPQYSTAPTSQARSHGDRSLLGAIPTMILLHLPGHAEGRQKMGIMTYASASCTTAALIRCHQPQNYACLHLAQPSHAIHRCLPRETLLLLKHTGKMCPAAGRILALKQTGTASTGSSGNASACIYKVCSASRVPQPIDNSDVLTTHAYDVHNVHTQARTQVGTGVCMCLHCCCTSFPTAFFQPRSTRLEVKSNPCQQPGNRSTGIISASKGTLASPPQGASGMRRTFCGTDGQEPGLPQSEAAPGRELP